jgi:hypothetical protein
MLDCFPGAPGMLAGAVAGPGLAVAPFAPDVSPYPPQGARSHIDAVSITSRNQMATCGNLSTTDWQGGIT